MVNLTTQYDINTTGVDGPVNTTGYTGRRAINNNEFNETILNISGATNLVRVIFFGLMTTDTDQYVQQSVYNVGRYGTTDIDWGNLPTYRVMPTNMLTAVNGGPLLTLANLYKEKYFGGVTQTPASLKAYLDDMYGIHNGYAYIILNGGDLFNTSNFGNTSNYTVCPVDYVENWAGGTVVFSDDINPTGYQYVLDVDVTDNQSAAANLIFGARVEPTHLRFDVYIDGAKDPNISVRWGAEIIADDFNLQMVNPIVWTIPQNSTPPPYVVSSGGILVPDENNAGFVGRTMRKYANTWQGQYDNPYLTEFNTDAAGASTIEKIAEYGLDQIADRMCYYMRFNYQRPGDNEMVTTWGDLWEVRVPRNVDDVQDIYVDVISDSRNQPVFTTEVFIHLAAPPDEIPDDDDDYPDGTDSTGTDPGVYDPDVPPHDFSTGESTGFSGKAILTKTYAMTSLVLQNIGSKLWSQSYFDVLKIQNNPIENIVSVKWFPFSVTGPTGSVKVGDVDFQINADVVDSIYKFTLGSIRYDADDKSNPSFLDMSPFTTLKLHLPYCGIIQLDATEMLNRKITVKYTVDLVSGDCMAFIYLDDNIPYMNVAGHCGVDIPLTSTNRVQAEMRAASTTISAMTGAAAHMVSGDLAGAAMDAAQGALSIGGMDYTSQRTSSHSPACTSTGNRACYLEVFKPAYKESAGFKSRHGYPCHLYKQLGSFTGFVKCDARTKIDFAMTKRENEMLEQLLTSGVYV